MVARNARENEKKNIEDDHSAGAEARKSREVPTTTTSDYNDHDQDPTLARDAGNEFPDLTSPTSPQVPSKGFKSLLNKLKRRSKPVSGVEIDDTLQEKGTGFIGGAALHLSIAEPRVESSDCTPLDADGPADFGNDEPKPAYVPHVDQPYSDVSSLTSNDDVFTEAPRGRSAERIVSSGTVKSGGTDVEEARDVFDASLAPPPSFTSDADQALKGSPNRDSKFHEVGL